MENFGSEIGQKMRSALKAKLVELGTGGTAGYIDDELPDYVMIMVANKRSKDQMIADLNLFLGSKTELFVTWLHEVLQKLQEVTLPANTAIRKRKTSHRDEANIRKEKKTYKKEKRGKKETLTSADKSSTTLGSVPIINSITEVFAEELLEKAKKTQDENLNAASQIKKGKGRKGSEETAVGTDTSAAETNAFDIPSITEMSSPTGVACVVSGNRNKDLAELAEIQKKIYAAKKQLKEQGDLKVPSESEDEDFLHLKDDASGDYFNENGDLVEDTTVSKRSKSKSPILFEAEDEEKSPAELPPTPLATDPPKLEAIDNDRRSGSLSESREKTQVPRRSRERERREPRTESPKKRPVHERLGMKLESRERRTRQEKELYVPAYRRKEMHNEKDQDRHWERDRRKNRDDERVRERERDRRGRSRVMEREGPRRQRSSAEHSKSPTKIAEEHHYTQTGKACETSASYLDKKRLSGIDREGSANRTPHRHSVGSRVIVAPLKKIEPSDEEDMRDKPVNSVIKIKPRPPVSPSKQACKNLLMRAVAEAQRSTILAKTKIKEPPPVIPIIKRLNNVVNDRNTKLYTKSYRDHLKRNAIVTPSPELFRRSTQNLVIEVEGTIKRTALNKRTYNNRHGIDEMEDEEYVPEAKINHRDSNLNYVYVPQPTQSTESAEEQSASDSNNDHLEYEEATLDEFGTSKTQFVVTLNDDARPPKRKTGSQSKPRGGPALPLPPASSSSSVVRHNAEASSTSHNNSSRPRGNRRHDIKSRLSTKPISPFSPSLTLTLSPSEHDSLNTPPSGNTPPPPRRTDFVGIYRKQKEVKKIIIKNDSEEDVSLKKSLLEIKRNIKHANNSVQLKPERSLTPPMPSATKRSPSEEKSTSVTPLKRKHTPIKIDFKKDSKDRELDGDSFGLPTVKRRSKSDDRERDSSLEGQRHSGEERRRISIRTSEANKYDNIPSLSSMTLDSALKVMKPRERCKYHPTCTKQFCEFYHPTAPCKSFPNCKFSEKCMYSHPKCKYDMSCTNIDCNFSHSGARNPSLLQPTAPPLSSHVVPVVNYKSISVAPVASSTMCKYYPNCNKTGCIFYHPKPCRFGKNCINKLECNFYHPEVQSSNKFKWVASIV